MTTPGFRPTFWPTLLTVSMLAVLVGLGTWQLQRLEWKTQLIAERDAGLAAAALSLPADDGQLAALEFRKVTARGRFLHDRELYVGSRTNHGKAGYHVLTPLQVEDGTVLLVNRGWVPLDRHDPASRPDGQVPDAVTVIGILRVNAHAGWLTPENQPADNLWFSYDLPAMARATGQPLRPAILEADAADIPGGLPVGGQFRAEIPNRHLEYALTWYALAAVLVVIYIVYHRRRDGDTA